MESNNVENKITITFDEFRAWLTGLIRGKNGTLPDLNDWKLIKMMMDKVVAEKEIITLPAPIPSYPHPDLEPYRPWQPWDTPGRPDWPLPQVWCKRDTTDASDRLITMMGGTTTCEVPPEELPSDAQHIVNQNGFTSEITKVGLNSTEVAMTYHASDDIKRELDQAFDLLFKGNENG